MANMKKHPFLIIETTTFVKLTSQEQKKLKKWLDLASPVLEELFKKDKVLSFIPKTVQVSLLICGDTKIKKLNRDHRQKDKVTDVLSFPTYEDLREGKERPEELFLGDLAICYAQTHRQAKEFDISFYDEFIHLFFHGTLHLMGYDHELSLKEEKIMETWEKKALDLFSKKKGTRRSP